MQPPWPLAGMAQQAKVPTVSVLFARDLPEFQIRVFREGLRELGYVEGQNIGVDIRLADGDAGTCASWPRRLSARRSL